MKIFEKILATIIALLIVSKLVFTWFVSIYLIVLLPNVSILYFFFGVALFNNIPIKDAFSYKRLKAIGNKKVIGSLFIAISLSLLSLTVLLFILRVTPSPDLIYGALVINVVFSIIVTIKFLTGKDKFFVPILKRYFLAMGLGLIYVYTLSLSFVKAKFNEHPDFVNAYKEYLENPNDKMLDDKMNLEFIKITGTPEEVESFEEYMNLDSDK
jgi:hypothetical protein